MGTFAATDTATATARASNITCIFNNMGSAADTATSLPLPLPVLPI